MGLIDAIWGGDPLRGEADTYWETRSTLCGRGLTEMRLEADILQYYAQHTVGASWEAEGRARLYADPSGGTAPVVVITDLDEELSVTWGAEDLATRLTLRFELPPETLWLLHFPPAHPETEGDTLGYCPGVYEDYQIITFEPPSETGAGEARFSPLSEGQVDRLRYWIPLDASLLSGEGGE